MRAPRGFALAALVAALTGPAVAGLTEAQLEAATLSPRVEQQLPLDLAFRDGAGQPLTLGQALGGVPAVLEPADYTCQTTCLAAVPAMADTVRRLGRDDVAMVVYGIDPADGPAEARAFGARLHLGRATLLSGDPSAVAALGGALGLSVVRDAERDQFAHPILAVIADPAGVIRRYLDPIRATPRDLRLALAEAGGPGQPLAETLFLTCYGWDPARGVYTLRIERVLMLAGLATALLVGSGVGLALLAERRRAGAGGGA